MGSNSADADNLSYRSTDETESPRRKMRLDNSGRRAWSLMDRSTDHEVLQEMGVSLLEPDDTEAVFDTSGTLRHKNMKRKHDIENVSPNVNLMSPKKSVSPKKTRSPLKPCSPIPGPSRVKSPSSEKSRAVVPNEQEFLDITHISDYVIDEETPLAQVNTKYAPPVGNRPAKCHTPLGIQEELILNLRARVEPQGADSFEVLSDEMLLSVFRWLPKRTLVHCMLVCKRWYQVACDETLWQRLDLGNKTLSKDALGKILARKPVIVRMANSEIGEWHPTTSVEQSRIQYLDLSVITTDILTMNSLLARCTFLKKLSLENVGLDDSTCQLIGKCKGLETLNLSMAHGITEEGLMAILNGCSGLQAVNVAWCSLSLEALEVLVTMLPQRLQRLNVSGARIMTDEMVRKLVARCPRLLELDLSDCSALGSAAVMAVCTLQRLEHLALSRCYLLPPQVLTKLNCMPSLQYLEVWGMLQTASLNALRTTLPAIQINQFMFSAIARPTVGPRRTSIWGLRTRD